MLDSVLLVQYLEKWLILYWAFYLASKIVVSGRLLFLSRPNKATKARATDDDISRKTSPAEIQFEINHSILTSLWIRYWHNLQTRLCPSQNNVDALPRSDLEHALPSQPYTK